MNFNQPWVYDERIAIILGWVTLILALSIFFSCRTFVGFMKKSGWVKIVDNPIYSKFYSYHGAYWWFFIIVLTIHFLTAFAHVGIPQSGDPDSPIHWGILLTGLVGAFVYAAIYFSCRSIGTLWGFFTDKGPAQLYPSFFKSHNAVWFLFGIIIFIHLVLALIHVGVWPPLG